MPIEICFQDEARLGQKNVRTRIWARTGTRPRLPADRRYENACLFGAICPRRGTAAALILPKANTEAMQMHLEEIGRKVANLKGQGCSRRRPYGSGRMAQHRQTHQRTSPSYCCPLDRQSSTRFRTSGRTADKTGSPTLSSIPMRTSSMRDARLATSSWLTPKP